MANEVVIPFPGSRFQPTPEAVVSSPAGAAAEHPEGWDFAASSHGWRAASHRSRLRSRIVTARQVVRAVIETLSYLGEARVRPPAAPALPAARSTK